MNLKVIVGMLVICCRAETQQRARIVWICFQLLPWASSLLFSSSLLSSSLLVLYSLFTYLAFAVETRAIVAAPCLNIFGYAVAVPANLLLLRYTVVLATLVFTCLLAVLSLSVSVSVSLTLSGFRTRRPCARPLIGRFVFP